MIKTIDVYIKASNGGNFGKEKKRRSEEEDDLESKLVG